jgi:hypothetical protein
LASSSSSSRATANQGRDTFSFKTGVTPTFTCLKLIPAAKRYKL